MPCDNIKTWDTKLYQDEFVHNYSSNRSTGLSPFRVCFGLVPLGPLNFATTPDKTRLHGEAVDFITDFQDIHKVTQSHLEAAATKYKIAADAKRRELIFEPGDLVWVYLTKERLPLREYNKLK